MSRDHRMLRKEARKGRNFGINTRNLRRARLITFGLLALPLLALGLLAGKFVSMPLIQAFSLSAYSHQDYGAARERAAFNQNLNMFEPYLPSLTRGTALLKEGQASAARTELEHSLELWNKGSDLNKPPHAECKIRNNLALAMAEEAGQLDDPEEAVTRYAAAEKVLEPCQSGGSSEQNNEDKETTGSNGEKIKEKREEAEGQGSGSGDSDGGEGTDEGDGTDGGENSDENDGTDNSDGGEDSGDSDNEGSSDGTNGSGDEPDSKEEQLKKQNEGDDSSDPNDKETKPW